jgi:hypothetical protein
VKQGRENGVARPWITEHQTVGIHGKPTELSLLQIVFESGKVGAFWKPNAARLAAKGLLVFVAGDQDLGADSLWMFLHQRQKSMCGRAGDDLQNTVVLESSKRSDEIALQTVDVDLAAFEKTACRPLPPRAEFFKSAPEPCILTPKLQHYPLGHHLDEIAGAELKSKAQNSGTTSSRTSRSPVLNLEVRSPD